MNRLVIYSWRRLGVGPKRYDWRLVAINGQPVATSGRQGYNDPGQAEYMGRKVIDGGYAGATLERI